MAILLEGVWPWLLVVCGCISLAVVTVYALYSRELMRAEAERWKAAAQGYADLLRRTQPRAPALTRVMPMYHAPFASRDRRE